MDNNEIELLQKQIAELETERTAAEARFKTAQERVNAVNAEFKAANDNIMLVKTLKGDTDDEKQDSFDKCMKEFDDSHKALKNIGKRLKAFGKSLKSAQKAAKPAKTKSWKKTNVNFGAAPQEEKEFTNKGFDFGSITVPSRYKTMAKPRIGFKKSFAMGMFGMSSLPAGVISAKEQAYAKDFIAEITKATGESFNETGGAYIPIGFYPFLIELINDYGVARRKIPLWPMKDSTLRVPRDSSLLAVYGEDENQAPANDSKLNSSTVQLQARKYMGTIAVPREIIEDSPIAFGAVISNKYAKSMAKKEDDAIFNGDGTATYNGTKGIIHNLLNTPGGTAAAIFQSTSTTFANMTRSDVTTMMGNLAAYAVEEGENEFYMSQPVYQILIRGKASLSQSTFATEIVNGIPQYKFDGIPVNIVNVMAQTDATSQICMLYGNLGMGCKMGDKRAYALDASDQAAFKNDQIVFRASERIAQVNHDWGTYVGNTDTSFNSVYGPIAALQSAA